MNRNLFVFLFYFLSCALCATYNISFSQVSGWSNPCCGTSNNYISTYSTNEVLSGSFLENQPTDWNPLTMQLQATISTTCNSNGQQYYYFSFNNQQVYSTPGTGSCSCPPTTPLQPVNVQFSPSSVPLYRGSSNTVSVWINSNECGALESVTDNVGTVFQIDILYCGDGVLTSPKQCDRGVGCLPDCVCNPNGYRPFSPIRRDCDGCGNGIYDINEQCDGGVGCLTNCTCDSTRGYRPNNNINCNGCGNGILDPGEQCDGGVGCLTNCTCDSTRGYRPTNNSFSCNGCGNGILDPGEQCDSGVGCLANCTCNTTDGYISNNTLSCTRCGNRRLDPGEQCDSGVGCASCRCLSLWLPQGTVNCTRCGNGIRDPGEQCDSGIGCLSNCTCQANFTVDMFNTSIDCSTCGNGIIDGNETCDSGEGCTPSCTCNSTTHQPYSPPRPSCQPIYNQVQSPSTSSTSQSLLGPIVGSVVGGAVLLIGTIILIFLLIRRKKRKKSKKDNMEMKHENSLPIEKESVGTSTPVSIESLQSDSHTRESQQSTIKTSSHVPPSVGQSQVSQQPVLTPAENKYLPTVSIHDKESESDSFM